MGILDIFNHLLDITDKFPKKTLILFPLDTLNIFAALLGVVIVSRVSTILEWTIWRSSQYPFKWWRSTWRKLFMKLGVSFSAWKRKLCTFFYFGSEQPSKREESDRRDRALGILGSGSRRHWAMDWPAPPCPSPRFFPAPWALWKTGFRSLTHVSLSGPSC